MRNVITIKSHTGLRGIAAFSVFMCHLYGREASKWGLSLGFFRIFQWGDQAVDLFFMLSGFILNHVYLERGTSVDWRRYFIARIARIVPLYYATLMVTPHKLGIFFAIAINSIKYTYWWGWGFAVVFLSNLFMLTGFWGNSPKVVNPPSWSISIEMFLYIAIFPILAKKAQRLPGWAMMTICGLSAALLYLINRQRIPPEIFGWPWTFMARGLFGFAAGFFLCSLLRSSAVRSLSKQERILRILILGVVLTATLGSFAGFFSSTVLDLLFPIIIYFTTRDEGYLCRLLGSTPLQWLGERSYSIYLWHYPILLYYEKLPRSWIVMKYPGSALINTLVLTLLVLVVSAVSYRYFEVPSRNAIRTVFYRKMNAAA
jgi:hypothetical protein